MPKDMTSVRHDRLLRDTLQKLGTCSLSAFMLSSSLLKIEKWFDVQH